MPVKKTPSVRRASPYIDMDPLPGSRLTAPWTTAERLERIAAMGQRIKGYIEYMCKVGNLHGGSAEAKERAVIAFYERMVVLERQLGIIQEELRLG